MVVFVVGVEDLEQVGVLEQRELDLLVLHEVLDLWGPEGGQVVEPGGDGVVFYASAREHARLADHTDVVDPEALTDLLHLGDDGLGVCGVAREDLDRNRVPSWALSSP